MKQTVFGRLENDRWEEYSFLEGRIIDSINGVTKKIFQVESLKDKCCKKN